MLSWVDISYSTQKFTKVIHKNSCHVSISNKVDQDHYQGYYLRIVQEERLDQGHAFKLLVLAYIYTRSMCQILMKKNLSYATQKYT